MQKLILSLMIIGFVLISVAAQAADEMPVKRVILSTSGLANFELAAKVDGNAALSFPVRVEQVDDILKSLVIFDEKGRLGGVTLPGKQPLQQIFKDLPFTQAQLKNFSHLVNAYQGAMVTVKEAGASVTGKIIQSRPEKVFLEDDQTVIRHRISLLTDAGVKQVLLEDAQHVHFKDQKVRREIDRALAAIRENSTAGQRMMTVNLHGKGARDVALSYVVDAPLWKAAYRMVLPETGEGSGLLQGWAVIENMTATDWANVDLTLVSGNPVTYRQALYEAYYVDRPEIPVQVFGRVMPRVDSGSIATAQLMEEEMEMDSAAPARKMERGRKESRRMKAQSLGGFAMADMAAAPMAMESFSTNAASMAQASNAAQSSEATTQVLFRFPDRFSLESGQSMMLPFVSRKVPMSRISLYQPETHATHPLAAVELNNDGNSGLPPGILTLYEESAALKGTGFIGDAQLPVLAQGEKRMVSYALDSKTTVNREDKSSSLLRRVTISQGVLRSEMITRNETVYTVKAPAKEDRMVVIEHPKRHDHKITQPEPKDVEVTNTHYRVRVPVKPGESKKQTVVLERTGWQSHAIHNMPLKTLMAYAGGRGKLDTKTRGVFEKLSKIRRKLDDIQSRIQGFENKKRNIFRDQDRVRENLKSLKGKSDLQQKYLEKLSDQEDQVESLDEQIAELNEDRMEQEDVLKKMIANIKF